MLENNMKKVFCQIITIGDEILFSSLIPNLKELSSLCILEANPRLVPLFNRSFHGVKVIEFDRNQDDGSNYTDFDFHIPTGDLPKFLWQKFGKIKIGFYWCTKIFLRPLLSSRKKFSPALSFYFRNC